MTVPLSIMKGNRPPLTFEDYTHLRSKVAKRLHTEFQINMERLNSGASSNYQELAQLILDKALETNKEPAASLEDVGYFSENMVRTLLYESRRSGPKERYTFRKVTFAVFSLFAYEEIVTKIPRTDTLFDFGVKFPLRHSAPPTTAEHKTFSQGDMALYDEAPIWELMAYAKKRVWIIDTYIKELHWADIRNSLRQAIQNGAEVKILLSHPNSFFPQTRFQALHPPTNVHQIIRDQITSIEKEIDSWPNKHLLEIQYHSNPPGGSLYVIDDQSFIGWFWKHKSAYKGKYVPTRQENPLGIDCIKHFQALWKTSHADLSHLPPKRSGASNFNILKKYQGTWSIYCNIGNRDLRTVRSPSDELSINVGQHVIGKSILQVGNTPTFDGLPCTLVLPHHPDSPYQGHLSNALNQSHLELSFYSDDQSALITMVIHVGTGLDHELLGQFTSISTQNPILSCGIIGMIRNGTTSPKPDFIPLDGELDTKDYSTKEQQMIRYLATLNESRLEPYPSWNDLKKYERYSDPCKFAGSYRVFAYNKRPTEAGSLLNIGLLQITPNYQIRHKRFSRTNEGNAIESYGRIRNSIFTKEQLIIQLKSNPNHHTEKYGYFILNMPEEHLKAGTYFSGIFAGYTGKNMAVGNRVIVEYMGPHDSIYHALSPQSIHTASELQDIKIPNVIWQIFNGRINNFIGFIRRRQIYSENELQKEIREEMNVGLTLFESACHRMLTQPYKTDKIIPQLRRAFNHGYPPIAKFEAFVRPLIEPRGPIEARSFSLIQRDEDYLDLKALEGL